MAEIKNPGFEAEYWTEDADGDPVFKAAPMTDDEMPRYDAVLAEVEKELLDGIAEEEAVYGSSRQENFASLAIALNIVAAAKPQRVAGLSAVLAFALYDERNARLALAKLVEEYESHSIEQDDRLANLAADLVEIRARVREVEKERDELLAALREANDNRLQIVEQHQKLIDSLSIAKADRRFAEDRANEAARLSAQARDDADALNVVIADLREQVDIVEGDRLANDAWAVNVIVEHDIGNVIEHQAGDEFAAIAKYIRAVRTDNATLAEFGDRAVESRDWAFDQLRGVTAERDEAKAEVSRLRVELEATQDDRDEARHTLRMMAARIKNVHQRYRGAGSPPDSCTECNRLSGFEVPYPCPTLQALGGES